MRDLDPVISRRTALTAVAVAGAAATLAACSTSGSANTPLRTGGNHAGNGGGGGGAASASPNASGGEIVIELAKVPMGSATTAKLANGAGVFVSRPAEGTANCFSRICTHMGCTVNPPTSSDPKELHCPCHGSIYNALTGAVIHGPAPKPLPRVAVTVQGGKVVTK